MQKIKLLSYAIVILNILAQPTTSADPAKQEANKAPKQIAEWSFLTYIAADNSLASFASYNINDMSKGVVSTNNSNILVQWDQPSTKKTLRYKITPGGKVDAGTISNEMGNNPVNELTAAVQWMVTNYPAKRYAVVLWNHGSGIEDFYPGVARGILYDDSQGTCLTNQGLVSALINIKRIIGKNLDIIAMDACLMAMVEVAYQMKNTVNLFVGSQQTIPGEGFPYSKFIKPLTTNPAQTTPLQLTQNIISSYQQFYTDQEPTPDFTLSTINLASIDQVKRNIDQFIVAVNDCAAIDASATKRLIVTARNSAKFFEYPEYIDLYSFYAGILSQRKTSRPKSDLILQHKKTLARPKLPKAPAYQAALDKLNVILLDGLNKITTAVPQNAAGAIYSGVKGLSIYYPKSGAIDNTYKPTQFAKDTAWINFISTYRA